VGWVVGTEEVKEGAPFHPKFCQ